MKMRRKLLLFLCAALLLTAGCGGEADSPEGTGHGASSAGVTEGENESAGSDDTAKDGTGTSSGEGSGSSASSGQSSGNSASSGQGSGSSASSGADRAGALYSLLPKRHEIRETTKDGSQLLLSGYYDTISLSGKGFDALSAAVSDWQRARVSAIEETLAGDLAVAGEEVKTYGFYGYLFEDSLSTARMDRHVLSIVSECLRDGAENSFQTTAVNFDARTGKQLTLMDIAADYTDFSSAVKGYAEEYVSGPLFRMQGVKLNDNYQDVIASTLSTATWYFDASGLVLHYDTGVLGNQAYEILLPGETFYPYLKEDYLPADGPGLVSLPLNEPQTVEGETGSLTLCLQEASDDQHPATLTVNGTVYSLSDDPLILVDHRLIRQQSGRLLLVMTTDWASDDYDTHFYEITAQGPRELWTMPGSRLVSAGADTVELQLNMDILGSTTAPMAYNISGVQPAALWDEYVFDNSRTVLTLTRSLPAAQNGSAVSLPAGTHLLPVSTDGESRITLKDTATGEQYEVSFTGEGYNLLIDGKAQQEYFEMLPYVG